MFSSYFKLAVRHMYKHKSYVFINIMGLAVGISFFVLIGLFVIDELSYDKFNAKKDRIYRLILDAKVGEQEVLTSTTPAPMAGVFTDEIPEIVCSSNGKLE